MTGLAEPTVADDFVEPRDGLDPSHVDDLGRDDQRRRTLLWIVGLVVALVVSMVVAVGQGPVSIGPSTWRG